MNITIAVDDNHPQPGWGLQGDPQMEYFQSLNEEFGAKFTLFIPSNYHQEYPISKYQEWIDWMISKPYLEIAAHGHTHQCEKSIYGEMEFYELRDPYLIKQRIEDMNEEWDKVGYKPKGWRNPGWMASSQSISQLQYNFEWAALHNQHNEGKKWNCKMIFGHVGINQQKVYTNNNILMFQSHIAGDHNDNVWDEKNYYNFRRLLINMENEKQILEFKTFSEL
jgi:peptidoglycan/xylan/chitin deacetylase (PgdA/CDA1 family)